MRGYGFRVEGFGFGGSRVQGFRVYKVSGARQRACVASVREVLRPESAGQGGPSQFAFTG